MIKIQIKAGTLFIALVISTILAILTASLIWYVHLNNLLLKKNIMKQEIRRNAESGLMYLLESDNSEDTLRITLSDSVEGTIEAQIKQWGLFDIALVHTKRGRFFHSLKAMIGYSADSLLNVSLYVPNNNKPLILAGNTFINGNVYVSEAGIRKAADIDEKLEPNIFVGKTIKSKSVLPKPANSAIQRMSLYKPRNESLLNLTTTVPQPIMSVSFSDPTVLLQTDLLKNTTLSGNIIIYSNKNLAVKNNAKLNDVILIAPTITFEKNFVGQIQAFATDTIIIEKGCTLSYPSILCIQSENNLSYLKIMENCRVEGDIILLQNKSSEVNELSKVEINSSTTIVGHIYADAFVQLNGKVYGSLFCNELFLTTASGYYKNHLKNTTINVDSLSRHFTSSCFFKSPKKRVVKWVL